MEILNEVFWGNSVQDWAISIGIILLTLLLNKFIRYLNKSLLAKMVKRTKTLYDDLILYAIETPILYSVMLVAIWISLRRLELPIEMADFVSKSYRILIILTITWLFARFFSALLDNSVKEGTSLQGKPRKHFNLKVYPLVRRLLLISVWGLGAIMALDNAGYDIKTLLSAMGIGGIAFALAAQDTVKNLIAGAIILTDQPFRIGDRIRFNGVDGTVEDVRFRSLRIRTLDKRMMTIPNYKVMDSAIENVSSEAMRKVIVKLGLTYDTTPQNMEKAMELLRQMPEKVEFVSKRNLAVAFTDFLDSALCITFIYYIEKKGDVLATNSKVNMEILSSFNEAGLNFAFPTQTIYVEK